MNKTGKMNGRFATIIGGRRRLYAAKAEYHTITSSQNYEDCIDAGGTEIPGGIKERSIKITDHEMSLQSLEEDLGIVGWDNNSIRFERKNYTVAAGIITLTDLPNAVDAVAFACQIADNEPLTPMRRGSAITGLDTYTIDIATGIVTFHGALNGRIVQSINYPPDAASGYSSLLPLDHIEDETNGYFMADIEGGFGSQRGCMVFYFPKLMRRGYDHTMTAQQHQKATDNDHIYNVQAGYQPDVSVYWE